MTKSLTLLAGAAMIASVGSASAAELLTPAQMDGVTAAGTYVYVQKIVYDDFRVYAHIDPHVYGNTAQAVAEAHAYGNNTFSLGTSYTYTDYYNSVSQATSTSITD
jgi:hypothetical protein